MHARVVLVSVLKGTAICIPDELAGCQQRSTAGPLHSTVQLSKQKSE